MCKFVMKDVEILFGVPEVYNMYTKYESFVAIYRQSGTNFHCTSSSNFWVGMLSVVKHVCMYWLFKIKHLCQIVG